MYAVEVERGGVDFTEGDSATRCHALALSWVQLNDVFPIQTGQAETFSSLMCRSVKLLFTQQNDAVQNDLRLLGVTLLHLQINVDLLRK